MRRREGAEDLFEVLSDPRLTHIDSIVRYATLDYSNASGEETLQYAVANVVLQSYKIVKRHLFFFSMPLFDFDKKKRSRKYV